MLPDDHDIMNNLNDNAWNLKKIKHPNSKLIFKTLMRAGAHAYLEHQYQLFKDMPITFRNLTEGKTNYSCCITFDDALDNQNRCSLDWQEFDEAITGDQKPILFRSFAIGNTGFIQLDTRFEATFTSNEPSSPKFIGQKQVQLLKECLSNWENSNDIDHIILITSVPLLFQSPAMSILAEFVENEKYSTYPSNIRETTIVLDTLFEGNVYKKLVLISGDLHMYYDSNICSGSGKCVKQIISSGMSTKSTAVDSFHLLMYFFASTKLSIAKISSEITNNLYTIDFGTVFLSSNYLLMIIEGKKLHWDPYLRPIEGFRDSVRVFLFDYFEILFVFTLLFLTIIFIAKFVNGRKKRKTL